jgi:hypothetical protein
MTDIPSWLQVGLATLSLGTAAAACLSAKHSAKAASQSASTDGRRQHYELHPVRNVSLHPVHTTNNDFCVELISNMSYEFSCCLKDSRGEKFNPIETGSIQCGGKKRLLLGNKGYILNGREPKYRLSFDFSQPEHTLEKCMCSISNKPHWTLDLDIPTIFAGH